MSTPVSTPKHTPVGTPKSARTEAVDLLDVGALGGWLDAQGLAPGAAMDVAVLSGGRSNLMFTVRRGDHRWVLRRPTAVARAGVDEGLRREFRFLTALEGTDVPHPSPVAFCDDATVIGCAFLLMDEVDGVNPLPLPSAFDDDHGRRALSFAMVDALAGLHALDPVAVGVADLGRPEGFHERQVQRWSAQLAGYGGEGLPGVERITAWLDAHRPSGFRPAIMHGDFHMLNALVAPGPPARVVAIVDWETATIGDPLLDLAGFCEIWTSATGEGWPARTDLEQRYVDAAGLTERPDLAYHDVLYNFRLGVLLEGIHQRALHDATRTDQAMLAAQARRRIDRASELVAGAGA